MPTLLPHIATGLETMSAKILTMRDKVMQRVPCVYCGRYEGKEEHHPHCPEGSGEFVSREWHELHADRKDWLHRTDRRKGNGGDKYFERMMMRAAVRALEMYEEERPTRRKLLKEKKLRERALLGHEDVGICRRVWRDIVNLLT